MSALGPTTPPDQVRGLRRVAASLQVDQHRRRLFAATVHLGHLARWPASVSSFAVPQPVDDALREDLLAQHLLDGWAPSPGACWLLRPGPPTETPGDRAWAHVLRRAADAWSLPVPAFYVVTRSGWTRPGHTESQTWARLRVSLPREVG